MWYVNVFLFNFYTACIFSFILTMWYVNLMIALEGIILDQGFILTMWYVNCTDKFDFIIEISVLY